ncbi:MAG: nitrogenase molybdenum-iron protein subunit beta [Betaproteobacteria bacterium]|nr:nitrogenase molybdenum-iron protein subunit beta [Betaproteobacteria bacterium]
MTQNAERILDHNELFRQPEYRSLMEGKKAFEEAKPVAEVKRVEDWTKSWEYREINFKREALAINPAKACQPLGAVLCASGFEGTMPYVHGSQGCVAYFRSHFNRHFKEPCSAVSDSMTEDAAVFGGMNNIIEGLANTWSLYKPKMIAMSTTCMAEVIGDDLDSFIKNAKTKGSIPEDYHVPFAHTPSFVGSHVTGYDNMLKGILSHFWEGRERKPGEKVNIAGGFDGYCVGNTRELKRILGLMDVDYTLLSDPGDVFDTPADGQFRMYDGGTTLQATAEALDAKATFSLQGISTAKSLEYAASKGQEVVALNCPIGVTGTDAFLMELSRVTGKAIPDELELERGRLVDAITDSQAYLHGKKFALFGDPDMTLGLTAFLLELGAEPTHVVCTNATKEWTEKMGNLLAASPFGQGCKAWPGKDLWHLRSLAATEPVDFLIGSSYGKFLERDTGTPLVRVGFPIFDRHHHHRYPIWGYQGGLNVLVKILDKIFDVLDSDPKGTSFDAVR